MEEPIAEIIHSVKWRQVVILSPIFAIGFSLLSLLLLSLRFLWGTKGKKKEGIGANGLSSLSSETETDLEAYEAKNAEYVATLPWVAQIGGPISLVFKVVKITISFILLAIEILGSIGDPGIERKALGFFVSYFDPSFQSLCD